MPVSTATTATSTRASTRSAVTNRVAASARTTATAAAAGANEGLRNCMTCLLLDRNHRAATRRGHRWNDGLPGVRAGLAAAVTCGLVSIVAWAGLPGQGDEPQIRRV